MDQNGMSPNEPKLGRKVLYKDCSFCPDQYQTWLPQAIIVFDWSISTKKIFYSEAAH
jgi:hypothetical protein